MGLAAGLTVTLLFALWPLLTVRRVTPLRALRANVAEQAGGDPLRWLLGLLLVAVLTGAAVLQAPTPLVGLAYAAGTLGTLAVLALCAWGAARLLRRFFPTSTSYPVRQGLANLFRPDNQTVLLVLILGFAAFLFLSMYLVEYSLLARFELQSGEDEANMILFDVQPTQVASLDSLIEQRGYPVLDTVPIVSMRLAALEGRELDSLRADTTVELSWAHTREYRSPYRPALTPTEEVVAGSFVGRVDPEAEVVPVSVEQDIAGDLGLELGDSLAFTIHGARREAVVASIRAVEWQRMTTNFFFVFPTGVLEEAPRSYVVLTRTGSREASAALRKSSMSPSSTACVFDVSTPVRRSFTI